MIYVWAIEQDELSKRNIPTSAASDRDCAASAKQTNQGQDVFVPWVLAQSADPKPKTRRKAKTGHAGASETAEASENAKEAPPKVFNRYYHMFAKGELNQLVADAAKELELTLGDASDVTVEVADRGKRRGVQILQDGWERSNYYVELRRWER